MNKYYLNAALGCCLMLGACSQAPKNQIAGTTDLIPDGAYVVLCTTTGVKLDSAQVKNQTFSFQNFPVTSGQGVVSYLGGKQEVSVPVFLEEGNIQLQLGKVSKASGTPANDACNLFDDRYAELQKQATLIYNKWSNAPQGLLRDSLFKQYNEFSEKGHRLITKTVLANAKNPFGSFLVNRFKTRYPLEEVKEWVKAIPQEMRSEKIKQLSVIIAGRENTSVGKKFVDITMHDVDGKEAKLSEYIKQNKYTLVDIWSSWCGFCRGEMPYLAKLYKQYHSQGFGLVGVSLDSDAKDWTGCIQKMNLEWDHISDLKGWKSPVVLDYGVTGLPTSLLISQDGTIVARDLCCADLTKKLAELFSGE